MSLTLYSNPDRQVVQAVGATAGAETNGIGSAHRITRSTAENVDQRSPLFTPSTQFTEVMSDRPSRLSKAFKLNDAGELVLEHGGRMSSGAATRVAVSSIADFAERLQKLGPSQALIFGVPDRETARIVTKGRLAAIQERPDDVISWDAESFALPSGLNVFMPCGIEPLLGTLGGPVADERA